MPILTIDAIRENPWSVLSYELPELAGQLLLELAYLAADYCRTSEYRLMMTARDGGYIPAGWKPNDDFPDIHEESESRSFDADRKLDEIRQLYMKKFGELIE